MYVAFGSACTERNSATPMDPAAVSAQAARVARMANHFVGGNSALDGLVTTLGGSGIGEGVAGTSFRGSAADFRNAPSCNTAIIGDGSLYGGRVASPGLLAGPHVFEPIPLAGAVYGISPGVVPLPTVLAAAPTSSSAFSAALRSLLAPGGSRGPAAAPTAAPSAPPSASGAIGAKQARATCAPPEVLPVETVFPIPLAGAGAGAQGMSGLGVPSVSPAAVLTVGAVAGVLWWLASKKGRR